MTSSNPLRISILFFILAAAVVAVPFLPSTTEGLTILLVGGLLVVCSFSTAVDRLGGRFDLFELIHPICYLSFIYFGAASLYMLYDPKAAYDSRVFPYLNASILLSIAGMAAMVYGYYLGRRLIHTRPPRQMEVRGVLWLAAIFAMGFTGQFAGLAAERRLLPRGALAGLVSLLQQLEGLSLVIYFLLMFLWMSGRSTPGQKLLLALAVAPLELALVYAKVGNKSFTLIILGMPFVAYYYARGRLPSRSAVVMLLVTVFLIFPFYSAFRVTSRSSSIPTRAADTVSTLTTDTPGTYAERSFFVVGQRMALINSVAVVVREVGHTVDFQNGRTIYLTAVSLAIPRFLWPDKPSIGIGQDFARQFGILPRFDVETNVAITPVAEWYWNFGVLGVVVGMFLTGIFYRFIYSTLGQRSGADPFRLAIYAGILPTLMSFEGNVAGWVGTTIRLLLMSLAAYWFLGRTGTIVPLTTQTSPRRDALPDGLSGALPQSTAP